MTLSHFTIHDWIVITAEVVALWSEETGLTPSDLASTAVDQNSASIEVIVEPSVLQGIKVRNHSKDNSVELQYQHLAG